MLNSKGVIDIRLDLQRRGLVSKLRCGSNQSSYVVV